MGSGYAHECSERLRASIACGRSASVHCSAVAFSALRNPAKPVSTACMADLLGVQTGDGQVRLSGLLRLRGDVMQQERSTGDRLKIFVRWANRTNSVHKLDTKATMRAMIRQRARSWVVKPPQPRGLFNSPKVFSASARSRQTCASARISCSVEATSTA